MAESVEQQLTEIRSCLASWKRKNESIVGRAWDIATKLSVPLVLGAVTAAMGLWRDVSVIEATRFTTSDGVALEARLNAEFPQEWLRDDLAEIKAALAVLQADVSSLDTLALKVEQALKQADENADDIDQLRGG